MKNRSRLPPSSLGLLLASAALCAVVASAQEPSMADAWRLDLEANDERRNGPPLVDTRLTVSMVGAGVAIERAFTTGQGSRTHEATYVTDGKPHDVPGILTPNQTVRVRWRKEKLQISYAISRGGLELDVTQVWSIDKQGALGVLDSTRVQDRNITRREIYRRE